LKKAMLVSVAMTGALLGTCGASGKEAPSAAPTAPPRLDLFPEAPERPIVVRACAACHAPEIVIAKRHSADEWDEIIAKMVDRGAVANEREQQQILDYLVRFFGPT
jgi:cytochrome c5